jgi:hypothetical protein
MQTKRASAGHEREHIEISFFLLALRAGVGQNGHAMEVALQHVTPPSPNTERIPDAGHIAP